MTKLAVWSLGAVVALAGAQNLARAADFSDPRKTVETCATAIAGSDAEGISACFTSSDAEKQKQIAGVSQVVAASHNLKQASIAKFGDEGNGVLAGGARRPGGDLADKIQKLKDADESITGDTATLTPKPEAAATSDTTPAKPLYFKKVGSDWKIDWDKQMAPAQGAAAGRPGIGAMIDAIAPLIAKAMNDTAAEIKAGKYASVESAKIGLQTNMRAAYMAAMPGGPGGRGAGGQ
jgi:hypothetical protein